jgi:hypothetical protein
MKKMGQDSKNPTNFCKYSNAKGEERVYFGKEKTK